MPTPLAHGLAGIAVARTVQTRWRGWHFAALAFAITLVPDLDFVPGVLLGEPGLFHRGWTHSLTGAALLSVPIAMLLTAFVPTSGDGRDARTVARFLRWYGFVLPVYGTHLLLDLLSLNTVNNSGLPLLWPFTDTFFMVGLAIPEAVRGLFNLEFGPDTVGFFRTFFSSHAMAVYILEALLFSPFLMLPMVADRLAGRGGRPGTTDGPRAHERGPAPSAPVREAADHGSRRREAAARRKAPRPAPADLTG